MASYFNVSLDTTAPAGVTVSINDGAQYTTGTSVGLSIGVSDGQTDGFQMKVWGTEGAASEAAAAWETFAATKSVTLAAGDGTKTVSVKVRDAVGNESSAASDTIILDASIPAVTITGPDVSTISKCAGSDAAAFSFRSDTPFTAYKVKVVPSPGSLHTAGTEIPQTAGSTNLSGSGAFAAETAVNCILKGADLEAASAGDGTKIVKVFIQNAAGSWSAA